MAQSSHISTHMGQIILHLGDFDAKADNITPSGVRPAVDNASSTHLFVIVLLIVFFRTDQVGKS